jgi:hypothetical protein
MKCGLLFWLCVFGVSGALVCLPGGSFGAEDKDWQEEYLKLDVKLQQVTVENFSLKQEMSMLRKSLGEIYQSAGKAQIDKARKKLADYQSKLAKALEKADADLKKHTEVENEPATPKQ